MGMRQPQHVARLAVCAYQLGELAACVAMHFLPACESPTRKFGCRAEERVGGGSVIWRSRCCDSVSGTCFGAPPGQQSTCAVSKRAARASARAATPNIMAQLMELLARCVLACLLTSAQPGLQGSSCRPRSRDNAWPEYCCRASARFLDILLERAAVIGVCKAGHAGCMAHRACSNLSAHFHLC